MEYPEAPKAFQTRGFVFCAASPTRPLQAQLARLPKLPGDESINPLACNKFLWPKRRGDSRLVWPFSSLNHYRN